MLGRGGSGREGDHMAFERTGNEGSYAGAAEAEQRAEAAPENVTGRRIVAALVDMVLLGVLFGLMTAIFGDVDRDGESFDATLEGWGFVAYVAVVFGYYILMEWQWRATLGKLLLGLRIAEGGEQPLTFWRVVVRQVLRVVDSLPAFYLLGLIVVAVSKRRQRIGDMAANTVVVRARRKETITAPRGW
jgi:uncharacterized RDD family membrane protein YckC